MNGDNLLRQLLRFDSFQDVLRVDDALEIRVGHLWTRQDKALLLIGLSSQSAKDRVEFAKSAV